MTLPATVADVLSEHVPFEIESIYRMYLNLYQPRLQHGAGIAAFFVGHRGNRFDLAAVRRILRVWGQVPWSGGLSRVS